MRDLQRRDDQDAAAKAEGKTSAPGKAPAAAGKGPRPDPLGSLGGGEPLGGAGPGGHPVGAWDADGDLMDAFGLGGDAGGAPPAAADAPADSDGGDVQAKESGDALAGSTDSIHARAQDGIGGGGGSLPHLDQIQHSFGGHDVSAVRAHTDGAAAAANQAMGAEAYATGDHVAFASASPTLHTVAHEAAHVVQQRGGVQLKGGVGEAGDHYEQHADAVADRVVRGESAQDLLDQHGGGGGGGVQHQVVQQKGPSQAISLDELRHAIDENNAANAIVGFRALSAADKRALAADQSLVTRLLAVVTADDGLTVLTGLRLPRMRALSAAAGARADEPWLSSVLVALHVNTLAALGAAVNDLGANPPYLVPAVLDPIINGATVTAQQQASFAITSNGETILRATWATQGPLEILHALSHDKNIVRNTFARNRNFATWLLQSEQILLDFIATNTDGAAWARVMWGTTNEPVLIRWIGADQTFWGSALADALLTPQGGDAVKLRASHALAVAVFGAIGVVQSAGGLQMVLTALHYTLAEKIKAFHDANLLDATGLSLLLNAPGTTAAQQSTMTQDDAVIALIITVSGGALAHEVLTILAASTDTFTAAVMRNNAFTHWVIDDAAKLVRTIAAVVNYPKWIDVFRRLNKAELLLTCASDTGIRPNFRAAILARAAYHWLVTSVAHPVPDNGQADALLTIFGEGDGITLPDKLLTWQCIYTTPLKHQGENMTMTGTLPHSATFLKTYYAVNPNNDAMNLFFHQYRQMPRTHVNTASAIMMCEKYQVKVTEATGTIKYFNINNGVVQVPAPGMVTIDTSYYMNNNWIVMKSRNATGAPVADRIVSQFGSPEAVNTPGTDPLSHGATQNMTLFANHATHEVGHAVGDRTLTHGGFNIKGDDWAKAYGHWQKNGTAIDYARTCGWTAANDTTPFTITDASGTNSVAVTGAQIRDFLTGIAQFGNQGMGTHVLTTTFGGQQPALVALNTDPVVRASNLFNTINQLWFSLPSEGYHFPVGIAGVTSVNFFCTRWDNAWVTYDATCFTNKVSNYSMSSYKEHFAELYTTKFTGGTLPAANNGQDPVAFFNALQQASPTELGLPATPAAPASPGAPAGAAGGQGGSTIAGGGAAGGGGASEAPQPLSEAELSAGLGGHPGRVYEI